MNYYEQLLFLSFTVGDASNPLSDRRENLKKKIYVREILRENEGAFKNS